MSEVDVDEVAELLAVPQHCSVDVLFMSSYDDVGPLADRIAMSGRDRPRYGSWSMRILFFSPFSGIWEFAAHEARLASALKAQGHDAVFVTCGRALKTHCVVMVASGLSPAATEEDRERVCRSCCGRADALRRGFDLAGPVLGEVVDEASMERIETAVERARVTRSIESTWDGIPAGRRALYPFLAYKKRDSLELTEQEWSEYADQLRQSMLSAAGARAMIDRIKPDAVITYSATYSVLAMFLEVARACGLPTYFTEASPNLALRNATAIFGRDGIGQWYGALRDLWNQLKDRPARPLGINATARHLIHLFKGESVFTYSSPARSEAVSIRASFGIPADARVLLATMSSYDEVFAAQEAGILDKADTVFASQIEWIAWLLRFVAQRPNVFLIIRVHPREFPTRREVGGGVKSTHARRLERMLVDLPKNCIVNWPSQNMSLYDVAKDIDVVLNAWSSAGKEMALLGIPVVEWSGDWLLYPPQDALCAKNPTDYGDKIDLALRRGWSAETLISMYRWCALEYDMSVFESNSIQNSDRSVIGLAKSLFCKIARRVSPYGYDAFLAGHNPIDANAGQMISRALDSGAPTLAHLALSTEATLIGEQVALGEAVKKTAYALFGLEPTSNRLHQNLLSLCERPLVCGTPHVASSSAEVRS